MRAILLIAWRDFKQTVLSPWFFLVSAFCAVVWSITYLGFLRSFAAQGMMSQMQMGGGGAQSLFSSVFVQHISVVNLIMIFVLPTLTMRLIAEEKKMRTYDLLLTSPVTSTQITLGKYLAGLGVTAILLLISFLYPAGTSLIAKFTWSTLFTLYTGIFFLMALYTATGLFASSLTESVILSVIMGIVFNLLVWFVGQSGAGSDIKWLQGFMDYANVGGHLVNFLKGMVKVSSTVFFLSLIVFFVFLTQRVVESSRWR